MKLTHILKCDQKQSGQLTQNCAHKNVNVNHLNAIVESLRFNFINTLSNCKPIINISLSSNHIFRSLKPIHCNCKVYRERTKKKKAAI